MLLGDSTVTRDAGLRVVRMIVVSNPSLANLSADGRRPGVPRLALAAGGTASGPVCALILRLAMPGMNLVLGSGAPGQIGDS